jgi:Uncharacterized protein conserved in bacteria
LALKEHDLTVAELSRKTGISTNTFYAMIRRDNNKISPEMLKKICDNTDITVYDLLDDYDELAAKYYDPKASKEEQTIGDYILTTMGNDDNLEGIIEIYGKLNNTGKKIAHEKISELEEVPQFTDTDNDIYIDPNLQKLYETAMQKAIHHEKLTEEDEQVIIGIPGQLRPKSDNPLSYENSYSFASSEEELNKYIKQQQAHNKEIPKEESQFIDSDNNIHKYDATIRISPEALENLKEINLIYKKIEKGEKLTENDLQTLKDYNQRQKIAMERLRETLRTMQERLKPLIELQSAYDKLNEIGQEEAAKRIEELSEIPRYTKTNTPPKE